MAAGPNGELWVKRTPNLALESTSVYDVFDPSGRYLTEVEVPLSFDLTEVGRDYLLGRGVGPLDVPYVVMFGLVRSRGS